MLGPRFTQNALRVLDWLAEKTLLATEAAAHLKIGRHGEEDAYFYLRRRGYTIIARNYRAPNCRGELDLVGWHNDVLCFVEVKTRTTHNVKPAQTAVDREKQKDLRRVARDFLRHLPSAGQSGSEPSRFSPLATPQSNLLWRFDVLAVYYDHGLSHPSFELFQNAFPVAYNRNFARHD